MYAYHPANTLQTSVNPQETTEERKIMAQLWAGILFHLPLAFLMWRYEMLATAHALLIIAIGLIFLMRDRTPQRLAYLSGYIVAADVLWRMSDAQVFWEYGKYAIVFLFGLGVFRWRLKFKAAPFLYFVPLLPSIVLTAGGLNIWGAREDISFNLSGPLALTVGMLFFSQVRFTPQDFRKLFNLMLMPIAGISFVVLYRIGSVEFIEFTTQSNFITSGGFGPNQISAILGVGVLLIWIYVLNMPSYRRDRWLLLTLGVLFFSQAIFTFSRGGVINILVAAPFATFYFVRDEYRTRRTAFGALMLLGLALALILPQLNTFTGNTLAQRYQNFYQELDTTGRLDLMQADLLVWQENFWFGVGPGEAATYHFLYFGFERNVAAHMEYSRLLAEHGFLGLIAMVMLLLIFVVSFVRARTSTQKGFVLAFMLWSFVEMSHSAMRLSMISFLFALALVQLVDPE